MHLLNPSFCNNLLLVSQAELVKPFSPGFTPSRAADGRSRTKPHGLLFPIIPKLMQSCCVFVLFLYYFFFRKWKEPNEDFLTIPLEIAHLCGKASL